MSQEAEEIRHRIENTRGEMSDTIDALGYKADVPSRVRERVSEKTHSVMNTISGQSEEAYGSVVSSTRKVGSLAQENPLALAVGGMAAGFLVGILFPTTRMESEKVGPVAEEFRSSMSETAGEAMERGKQVAQEAVQSAVQTAKESGGEQGQELKEEFKHKVQGM